LYCARPEGAASGLPPLLLVHSVNAAGSAAEVAPLFAHYRQQRAVYALDLPGFGCSERSDRPYTVRLMTDALLAALRAIQAEQAGVAVDVLAVSLACEFAARVAVEAPQLVRRLALVSPTGFSGKRRRYGAPGAAVGPPWLFQLLSWRLWSAGLYNTLTRPAVIRYFLQRTWGSSAIDEALWRYDLLTTRQPGAQFAPLAFVSAPTSTPCTRRWTVRSGCRWRRAATSPTTRAATPCQGAATGSFMPSPGVPCHFLKICRALPADLTRFGSEP
jgi:pimeloyl-ACP methyl ester carboxylesterase